MSSQVCCKINVRQNESIAKKELIKKIKDAMETKHELLQIFLKTAQLTENEWAEHLIKEIAHEDRVHAGNMLFLLKELAPEEENFHNYAATEIHGEIKRLKSVFAE